MDHAPSLLLVVFLLTGCASQPEKPPPRYAAPAYPMDAVPHAAVSPTPSYAEVNTAQLGKYIASREPNPYLRAKAVHDWIALNIEYATKEYLAGEVNWSHGTPAPVFANRYGVCSGMSALYAEIATYAGLDAIAVDGDVGWPGRTWDRKRAGHVWNAVLIDGRIQLLDVTWDGGSASLEDYSTDYLFAPPDLFLNDHYPEQWKYQLQARPISLQEWLRQPSLYPAFFKHGWVHEGTFQQGGQLTVTLRATQEAGLSHSHLLHVGSRASQPCQSSVAERGGRMVEAGERVTITCTVPPGRHELRIAMGPDIPRGKSGRLAEIYVGPAPPKAPKIPTLRPLPDLLPSTLPNLFPWLGQ